MSFDIDAARNAGYSDKEIQSFLNSDNSPKKFDAKSAKEAGYTDAEIKEFLSDSKGKVGSFYNRPKRRAGGIAGAVAENPLKALGEAAIQGVDLLESGGGLFSNKPEFAKKFEQKLEGVENKSLSQFLREKAGIADLPPEEREELETFGNLVHLFAPFVGGKIHAKATAPPKPPKPPKVKPPFESVFPDPGAPPPPGGFGPDLQALIKKEAPANRATQLAQEIVPGKRISPQDLAESALKEVEPAGFEPKLIGKEVEAPKATEPATKPLQGRIAQTEKVTEKGGEPLGLRLSVPPKEGGRSLTGRVAEAHEPGISISPLEFESEASGGTGSHRAITEQAALEREPVTAAYNEARENYQNINSIADTQLIDELESEISGIKTSLKPNTAESTVLKAVDDVMHSYRLRNGVPVQTLLKTSDSISGMANYELPFTGPKEILKRVAKILDNAAIRAVENNGGNADLIRNANRLYGRWADKFARPEIAPFLERNIRNPEQLFRKTISDEETYRSVRHALSDSQRGSEYTAAYARKIAENRMGKYAKKKTSKVGSQKYNKDLRNLRALIGDDFAHQYDLALRNHQRQTFQTHKKGEIPTVSKANILPERVTTATKTVEKPVKAVREAPTVRISPQRVKARENKLKDIAEKAAKHAKRDPEEVLRELNSRSGIKRLRKEFTKDTVDKLTNEKMREILHEGEINHEFTGTSLRNTLNKQSNYELFTEILGKEETDYLLEVAEEIGKDALTYEKIRKSGLAVAKVLGATKALKVLTPLL